MAADKTGAAWGEHNATQQWIQRPLIVSVPVVSANYLDCSRRFWAKIFFIPAGTFQGDRSFGF
jgi:hypothetical protein